MHNILTTNTFCDLNTKLLYYLHKTINLIAVSEVQIVTFNNVLLLSLVVSLTSTQSSLWISSSPKMAA